MVTTRSKGDPISAGTDPEAILRQARANKRKATAPAAGQPAVKKVKAAPVKKAKKTKSSGRKKKGGKVKKAHTDKGTNTADTQQQTPPQAAPAPVPDPAPTPLPAPSPALQSPPPPTPPPATLATPQGSHSPAPSSPPSPTPSSVQSSPPPSPPPADPRRSYAGKTLPGQRRPAAVKQPRENPLPPPSPSDQGSQAQSREAGTDGGPGSSSLGAALLNELNNRVTPPVNTSVADNAANNAQQAQGQAASNTPGPNDVVQTTETVPVLPAADPAAPAAVEVPALPTRLTEEERRNPGAALHRRLQHWRDRLQGATSRPDPPSLSNPVFGTVWMDDEQVAGAITAVSEAIRLNGGPTRAIIGTFSMGRLASRLRLSTAPGQDGIPNDFWGQGLEWFLPVNVGLNHWILAHIRMGDAGVVNVTVYDSLNGHSDRTVKSWIQNSEWFPLGQVRDNQIIIERRTSTTQDDGWECGRFAVLNAWALMLGMTPAVSGGRQNAQAWTDVHDAMNLALRGHLDAATIEGLLLCHGYATRQMQRPGTDFTTTVRADSFSLNTLLSDRVTSGRPNTPADVQARAANQQRLNLKTATAAQREKANQDFLNDVENTVANRGALDRSTPEVENLLAACSSISNRSKEELLGWGDEELRDPTR